MKGLWLVTTLVVFLAQCEVVAAGTNDEGLAFLEANKAKPGVITLPSGLQYKVLREGGGDQHPKATTQCKCHYKGTLIDGTQFDSSYDRGSPTSFAPSQVIKGWTEAMQLMVEGDKWEMYIPSELGYGDRGSPPKIPGGSVLVFTMEIIAIDGDSTPAEKCDPATLAKCSDKEKQFVGKFKARSSDAVAAELARLKKIDAKNLKADLAAWLSKRITLLTKLDAASAAGPDL